MDQSSTAQIHEVLPKTGLVVSEKGQLTEVILAPMAYLREH
jgi:hypothetical protein